MAGRESGSSNRKIRQYRKPLNINLGIIIFSVIFVYVVICVFLYFTQKHENIWIAQREGRAKDSNDRTQDSVLKMLAMGGEGDIIDRLQELNIVPLALSYEYDPCDYLKAQEMQQKRDIEGFKKSKQDDLNNMQMLMIKLWKL